MSDLELLRQFRSEVEPPDETVTASAYRRVLGEADEARAGTARRRGRARRLGAPARIALAACVAAATAAAVLVLLPGGHTGGTQNAAAAVLLKVAKAAASQTPVGPPRPGQYVYTKSKSLSGVDTANAGPNHNLYFSVQFSEVREAWIGPDGSGRILESDGTPTFVSSRDRSVWIAAGRPPLPTATTRDISFAPANENKPGCKGKVGGVCGGLGYLDLSKFPTDVPTLKRMIEERKIEGDPPGDLETFTIIGDMLRETYAPPLVRSALFQIVSQLREVELVGNMTDPVVRAGIAVAYPVNGILHELIFDPSTSALLGERTVIVDPDRAGVQVSAGTVVGWSAYLASGVVDSTSERS
jgi:hypothetical protein